jgi:Flp pilus assembly protein TadD
MKKHKHNRHRHEAKAQPAPRKVLNSSRTKGAWQRRIYWLAGVGLVLLLGFFLFNKHNHPIAPVAAGGTNRTGAVADREARLGAATAAPAQDTNGPWAVVNKDAQGGPISGADFTPHTRPGAVVNRQKEGQAADLNSQAGRLLEAGDTQRAIQLYEQAQTLLPTNEALHYNLGFAFAVAGNMTNAEHEYKEALRLVPDYPEAHEKYGELLAQLGRLPEAEEHLAEAVEQMPESAQSQNSLGVARQRRNKTNEALLCFQKAIACNSNYWLAHYNLALSYLNQKNREKEIAELRQTLRINPAFEPAQHALALALAQETPKPPAAATPPK